MSGICVAGIDWSTDLKNRALVTLRVGEGIAVQRVESPLRDERVVEVCKNKLLSVVAVDVPFGWPVEFSNFVSGWLPQVPEEVPPSENFRFRTTERRVQRELGKTPLSVSSNFISLSARAWADIVYREGLGGRIDVGQYDNISSNPGVIEVYPAATLTSLAQRNGGEFDGYKKNKEKRSKLLNTILRQFKIECDNQFKARLAGNGEEDDDKTDAFLAALTALMYLGKVKGWTVRKPSGEEERNVALKEGWIFFPIPSDS